MKYSLNHKHRIGESYIILVTLAFFYWLLTKTQEILQANITYVSKYKSICNI